MSIVRHADGTFHWEGVDVLKYKDEGAAPFKDVLSYSSLTFTFAPASRARETAPKFPSEAAFSRSASAVLIVHLKSHRNDL